MRAHHERARQRASFNAWVCGLASHASVFLSVSFQYQSANSPALVQWRFVCICVRVCMCLCVCQRYPRVFYSHSHTPNTLDYAVKPCPLPTLHPVCSIIIHSFFYYLSLSLSLCFGWLNVQVTFDIILKHVLHL